VKAMIVGVIKRVNGRAISVRQYGPWQKQQGERGTVLVSVDGTHKPLRMFVYANTNAVRAQRGLGGMLAKSKASASECA